MNSIQDQTIFLGAVHTATTQVDRLAYTGEVDDEILECMINSLLVINPQNAFDVYGGSDRLLKSGYQVMGDILTRNPDVSTSAVHYALMLLTLERRVIKNAEMMQTIGQRLELIRKKVEHFGALNENVIQACSSLYEDTVSKAGRRIMVLGEPNFLNRAGTPEKIRTVLLAGMRAALQWRFSGGRYWRLILQRRNTLEPALERLDQIKRQL